MKLGRFSLSYITNTTQLNMMKIDHKHKVNKLTDILRQQFGNDMHLARIKFIALFIISLCKVQTVGFEKLANAFDCYSESSSNLRRIQRFMAKYQLDSNLSNYSKLIRYFSPIPRITSSIALVSSSFDSK